DERFNIIHIQTPYSPFMGHKVINNSPDVTAVISTFHIAPNSSLVNIATRLLGVWLKTSLKTVDIMLSVSTAARDFSKKTFGYESKVLPNPVDYNKFHKAQPLSKYKDNKVNILYLG